MIFYDIYLQAKIAKLQSVWDLQTREYRLWNEFQPPRKVPSQYSAFEQLRLRWKNNIPILAALIAPAGFGKTELAAAWLYLMASLDAVWELCAVTGVAAAQLGGTTLHSLLRMRADGTSALSADPEHRRHIQLMEGYNLHMHFFF